MSLSINMGHVKVTLGVLHGTITDLEDDIAHLENKVEDLERRLKDREERLEKLEEFAVSQINIASAFSSSMSGSGLACCFCLKSIGELVVRDGSHLNEHYCVENACPHLLCTSCMANNQMFRDGRCGICRQGRILSREGRMDPLASALRDLVPIRDLTGPSGSNL